VTYSEIAFLLNRHELLKGTDKQLHEQMHT